MSLPIIAIVGRQNVGKSTLFNRLVGGSASLVADEAGVTRDRHHAQAELCGQRCVLVDTGGFLSDATLGVDALVRQQVQLAIDEADLCLLVIDGRTGVATEELELLRRLRKAKRPFLIVPNKIDHADLEAGAADAYRLGAQVVAVSAEHGRNIAELLDSIVKLLPISAETDTPDDAPKPIRVAIIGRPNAGKSSLCNALCGQLRVVVHEEPGTTRDPIDVVIEVGETKFKLVDTAGIRRRRLAAQETDRVAMLRATRAIALADVCALVVDSSVGISTQDAHIAELVERAGRALVIVMNKWDLVQGSAAAAQGIARKQVASRLPAWSHAPLAFISARTGLGVRTVPTRLREIFNEHRQRIPTSPLNHLLKDALEKAEPPSPQGRRLRFYYVTQARAAPPTFVISTNRPSDVPEAYRRYLLNQIRARFGFNGSPLRLEFRAHREGRRAPK